MASIVIAGEQVEGAQHASIRSPWDGGIVDEVGLADAEQVEAAIAAAHASAASIGAQPTYKRRDLLRAIAARIGERKEALASLMAREAGKPITQARVEVDRAVQTFSLGAEEATRLGGDASALDLSATSEGVVSAWTRVPAGPVLAITPFNFPINLVAHKLAPAFALGAPVVLKPAPQTPLTALALAGIVRDAGALRGTLSVIPTTNELAAQLVRDERFGVVSFTGSARVGWGIKASAGKKRVLLELGGNAAAIVEPDADLEYAANKIVAAGYSYAGQVCIKVQRVFVDERIADKLVTALAARVQALQVGDPMDAATVCGPMIDEAAAVRVASWIAEAMEHGARVLVGGERTGNRLVPALVENAPEGTQLVDEEVFGPVVTVHRYRAIDEAIESIERGRYGLQAALFTRDIATITKVFRALHVGALVVNDASTLRVDSMPYGGVKDSGFGREGVRFAIDEMSEKRLLVIRTA